MAKPRNLDLINLVDARNRWERHLRTLSATNDGKPAPNTITTYLRDVDEMIRLVHGENRAADDIEPEDITDALLAITTAPDRRYTRTTNTKTAGRSVASRARWASSVRAFFTWATTQGYVQISPMDTITVTPPPKAHQRTGLTLEETRTLIHQAAKGDTRNPKRDYALICLMAESGPRVSEICRLTTTDLLLADTGTWIARIRQAKGRKDRDLPVSDTLAHLIDDYARTERTQALTRRQAGTPEPAQIFLTHNGQPLTPRDIQRMLAATCKKAGIRHGTPHQLRHTAFTQMGITGVAPQTIRDIAGHTSLDTTSLYLDVSDEENAAAIRHSPLVTVPPQDA